MNFSKENAIELLDFIKKHIPKAYHNTIEHIKFVITCVWED